MSRTMALAVSSAQIPAIRSTVQRLRDREHRAVHTTRGIPPLELDERRKELHEVDALLDQLTSPIEDPRVLVSTTGLLRRVMYGTLVGGVDRLARLCRIYEAGQAPLPDLAGAVGDVAAHFELFAHVEELDGDGS